MQSVLRRVISAHCALSWRQPFRGNVNLAVPPIADQSFDWEHAKPYSEVPGPKPLPLLGNAWRFMPGIGTLPAHDFKILMEHMHKTYGPVSKISNVPGKRDVVFLFDPRDFEVVYRNEGVWPERQIFDSFPYYRNVVRKDFFQGASGILSVNGEEWQKFRTYVNPVLMQPKNSRMYANQIDEVTNDFMALIPSMLDEKHELPADFNKELQKWAFEAISLIALDTRIGCLKPNLPEDSEPYKMIEAVSEIFKTLYKLDIGFPLWKYITTPMWKRAIKHLDIFTEYCANYITNAQEKLKHTSTKEGNEMSVLEKLLIRDPDPKKAIVMAMDMMMAGIDTTSVTAASVMYHLARNPDVQEQLYKELCLALPEKNSPITADILDSLRFLKACVRENNRMNPVAIGNSRRISVDIVVGNYCIPKETDIMMCHMLTSNNEKHFPQPNKFAPDRWLKNREAGCPVKQSDNPTHPFAMMPFGFGKRNCVGMRFAMLEIETIVAKMIRNYRLEWHYEDMTFKSEALYEPKDPMKLRLFPRTDYVLLKYL